MSVVVDEGCHLEFGSSKSPRWMNLPVRGVQTIQVHSAVMSVLTVECDLAWPAQLIALNLHSVQYVVSMIEIFIDLKKY